MKSKLHLILGIIIIVGFLTSGVFYVIAMNADTYVEMKEVLGERSCMDNVMRLCYNVHRGGDGFGVNNDKYNECKFTTFIEQCSYEDCMDYFGCPDCFYTPEIYEQETAKCAVLAGNSGEKK